MNVAYDGMLLSGRFSGVELCIAELFRHLHEREGCRYTIYAPRGCPADVAGRARLVQPRLPTRFRAARIVWEQFVLPHLVARDGAAVLHAPGYVMPLAARIPTVLTVYDTHALDHPGWCTWTNRLHYGALLPRSIRRAARVIVPSEATRADLCRRFPEVADRVRIIRPGVRASMAQPADPGARARFRTQSGLESGYALFVGNIEPRKNLPMLLRAFHAVRAQGKLSQRLVIVGEPGRGMAAVRQEVLALGLDEEVRFWGYASDSDLALLYAASDALVFPSLHEGFGLPAVEAMACGAPVIVSDRGALPEVAGAAGAVVPAEQPDAWARALADVLGSPVRQAEMRVKGTARARAFSWAAAAQQTECVYRDALAGQGSGGAA